MNRFAVVILLSIFFVFGGFSAVVTYDEHNTILIDGWPFFPIMQWLQTTGNIEKNKNLGINTFTGVWDQTTEKALEYLEAYNKHDVWGIVHFDSSDTVINHPALLGWIFGDEPDLQSNATLPDTILSEYNHIKNLDTNHLTFLTVTGSFYDNLPDWMNGDDSYYYGYAAATDVIGFDKYPIYGWCRKDWLYWVGDAQDTLHLKYAKGEHPTYQWIECIKCCSKWCDYPERDNLGPFPNEIRCEVWYAIIHGAKAIGYFTHTWRPDDCQDKGTQYYKNYQVTPGQEAELIRTNGQITALTPVLSRPNLTNVTPMITSGAGRIDVMTKGYNNTLYIFAVNVLHVTDSNTQLVSCTVPGLGSTGQNVKVYDESRTLTPVGDTFVDTFTEEEPVHIYTVDGIVPVIYTVNNYSLSSDAYHLYSSWLDNSAGSISFSVIGPKGAQIKLSIVDISGRVIKNLFSGILAVPRYSVTWNGVAEKGGKVSPGIYFCRLQSNRVQKIVRVVVLK